MAAKSPEALARRREANRLRMRARAAALAALRQADSTAPEVVQANRVAREANRKRRRRYGGEPFLEATTLGKAARRLRGFCGREIARALQVERQREMMAAHDAWLDSLDYL